MNILLIGGLSDDKFISKTKALIDNHKIANVFIFRSEGLIYKNERKVKFLFSSEILFRKKSVFIRIIYDFYNLIGFSFLLVFKKIDLIVGLYLYPHGYYACKLGKIFNKPVILILPGTDLKKLAESKKHLNLFKGSNYIGLRGSYSIRQLIKLGFVKEQLFILPNMLDFKQFQNLYDIKEKKYDIVFAGYLRKLKRIDSIIHIVNSLKTYRPHIRCLITGDGPEKNNLVELSRRLNLLDNIEFKPYTHPIESVLILGKIYLLTSESEGLPMSLIEAMGCGLPVITSNINDIPDVVEHGVNGFLIEPTDLKSFTEYCKLLLEDNNLRLSMGKAARDRIKQLCQTDYSYEALYKLWDNLLEKCLKHNT